MLTREQKEQMTRGQRVRATRSARGLTLEEVARRTGISTSSVWRIENDQHGSPKESTVAALAKTLKIGRRWVRLP